MMATAMEIAKQGRGTGTMDGIRQNRGLWSSSEQAGKA